MTEIILYNYKKLDLLNPDPDVLTIDVIAHGLSNVCRFAAQSPNFYSVADHSISGARYFIEREQWLLAKEFLLHDATEAFMGDLATPLKKEVFRYLEIETVLDSVIRKEYKLPEKMSKEVKTVDKWCFEKEFDVFFPTVPSTNSKMPISNPYTSKQVFLETYWIVNAKIQK